MGEGATPLIRADRLARADKAHKAAAADFDRCRGAVESAPAPPSVEAVSGMLEVARAAEEAAREALHAVMRARSEAYGSWLAAVDSRQVARNAEESRLSAKKAVDGLAGLQKYLRSSRSRLSAEIWGGLLDYASHLVGVATSGRMGRLERSEKGEFTAGGVPVDDDGGAMKSLVGLALRVSLARTFYGAGLPMLLDEPSADASDSTANAITGMLIGLGSQIISVTHRTDAVLGNVIVLEADEEPEREVRPPTRSATTAA